MSPKERQHLQALADAATPGPWYRSYGDIITADDDPRDVLQEDPRAARVFARAPHRRQNDPQALADAIFIAAARTAVPALLADIAELERRIEKALAVTDRAATLGEPEWKNHQVIGYNAALNTVRRALTEEEK